VVAGGFGHGALAAESEATAGNVTRGARTWAQNCSRCHNMRSPTEFRDDLWKPIVTHMRIRAGLTGQQQRDVLAFLQASNSPAPVKVSAGDTLGSVAPRSSGSGKSIYEQTCVACHGADGTGLMPGVPDFTAADGPLSKPADLLLQHISDGFQSPGSPMAMPAKGGNPALNEADIRAVLGYVKGRFGR